MAASHVACHATGKDAQSHTSPTIQRVDPYLCLSLSLPFLGVDTIMSLASTCRDLRQCIRSPSLWRSLTITGDLGASCSLPRVLAFLHRMHLTRHIHRLKLRNVSAPLSPACPQVLLPHLEELDVSAQAPPSALASASLLACLQAPKLHRVAWFGPLHDTSAIHLARLIPHLRELELDPVCLGQPPKLSAHVVHLLQGALATAEMPRLALRATASSSQLGQRSCSPLAEETLQTLVRDSSDATGHRGGEEEVQLGRAAETELVFDHEDFAEDVAEAEPADAESSPTAQLDEEREAPLEAVGAADASSVRTEGLRLEYMYATATSVQMAARGPCKQHEVLKLGSCPMGYVPPASLGSLVRQCNQLGGLRELSLSFTHLGTEGLEAILAHCPRLRSLRVDTRAVNFDDACLRAIATACVQLEELVVNCPCVERTWGNDGVLRLAFRLSSLRKLHLGGFQANKNITAGALFRLVEKMPRLTHVFLQDACRVTQEDVRKILEAMSTRVVAFGCKNFSAEGPRFSAPLLRWLLQGGCPELAALTFDTSWECDRETQRLARLCRQHLPACLT